MEKIKTRLSMLKKEKVSTLLLLTIVLNTVCLLVANIIACKTFSIFTIPGIDISVLLPCAVVIFPITYILSDVISEVYGYKWSRRASWISFGMNILMVIVFELAIKMPGETDLSVLHSTWFLLLSSLLAYMVGDFINDIVFKKLKERDGKKFLKRALLSSLLGEFTDSIIYIPLGMYVFPKLFLGFSFMSPLQMVICILLQPLLKVLYELVVSPLTYNMSKYLKKIENN